MKCGLLNLEVAIGKHVVQVPQQLQKKQSKPGYNRVTALYISEQSAL